MGTQTPYEDFMAILKKHLKQEAGNEGKLVIAIENKFGLKYWAGCREDHTGELFSGIEDYPAGGGARTFTRKGLEKICAVNGVKDYTFYYPYPDYKFMTTLYSDKRMPMPGELSNNMRNFDRSRLLLFDEKNAFDTIIKEGEFPLYSNSYMLVTGKEPEIKYTKYSNDRAEQFAIRTDIMEDANGERWVEKVPMTPEASRHIANIKRWYELLQARYAGSGLHINECREMDGKLQFSYIKGVTLEEMLDECVDKGDMEGFVALIEQFKSKLAYANENSSLVSDFDVVFANILIHNNDWYLIDYEWTEEKEITIQQQLMRSLYFYIISSDKRRKLKGDLTIQKLGLDEATFEKIVESEKQFQQYVTGKRMAMTEMRDAIGQQVLSAREIEALHFGKGGIVENSVQIYTDEGAGCSEETSYFVQGAYKDRNHISFSLEVDAQMKYVRIDPAMDSCIVTVDELTWNGKKIPVGTKRCMINGTMLGKNTMLFATTDPNIIINVKRMAKKQMNTIQVKMEIVRIPIEVARQMAEVESGQKG